VSPVQRNRNNLHKEVDNTLILRYKQTMKKPNKVEQAFLDLTDGDFHYWEEIRDQTGFDEKRCKEILEVIQEIREEFYD
jgi:RNAse (barnase) inhibitor barstar